MLLLAGGPLNSAGPTSFLTSTLNYSPQFSIYELRFTIHDFFSYFPTFNCLLLTFYFSRFNVFTKVENFPSHWEVSFEYRLE